MSDRALRTAVFTIVAAATAAPGLAAAPGGELPIGLTAETIPLMILVAIAVAALGAILLFAGWRFPRLTVGSFLLAVSSAISFGMLAPIGYLVAALVTLFAFAVAYAVYLVVPRLVLGLSALWILPALYGYSLYSSGSFERSLPLAIGLAAAGAAVAAIWPRVGTILLATAAGCVAFVAVWPGEMPFAAVLTLAGAGLLAQVVGLQVARRPAGAELDDTSGSSTNLVKTLGRGVGTAAATVAGVLIAFAVLSPEPAPASPAHAERLEALRSDGALSRPGVLLSKDDALYLTGRALPIALVGPAPGLSDRLWVLLAGRSPRREVHRARTVKSEAEVASMRRAAEITSLAMARVGHAVAPGVNEGELARIVDETFRENGADGYAFASIVGSGPNACLPHYDDNDAVMESGFVVVDIGCTVDGYASDMTRTFPVARSYTPAQLELIRLVAEAKNTAAARLGPDVSYLSLSIAAREVFEKAGLDRFFLHGLGHHVGVNVHDPGADLMKPGMVVTIEPGLYIKENAAADERFRGLGVRIEDSYLVTADGAETLTHYPQIPFLEED